MTGLMNAPKMTLDAAVDQVEGVGLERAGSRLGI